MQIKMMRCHLIPVRMAVTKISKRQQVLEWMWRKRGHHALLMEIQIGTATLKNSMEIALKN